MPQPHSLANQAEYTCLWEEVLSPWQPLASGQGQDGGRKSLHHSLGLFRVRYCSAARQRLQVELTDFDGAVEANNQH